MLRYRAGFNEPVPLPGEVLGKGWSSMHLLPIFGPTRPQAIKMHAIEIFKAGLWGADTHDFRIPRDLLRRYQAY